MDVFLTFSHFVKKVLLTTTRLLARGGLASSCLSTVGLVKEVVTFKSFSFQRVLSFFTNE